jgi:hypothetical protein
MKTLLLIVMLVALAVGYYMYSQNNPAPAPATSPSSGAKAKLENLAKSQGIRLTQFLNDGAGNCTVGVESSTDKKTAGEDFINKAVELRLIQPDPQQIKKGVNADAVRGSINWWQYQVVITP